MDKYEYRIKAEQIRKLAEQEDFASAMKIANTIDWNRVRSIPMLCLVGEIYEKNNMLEESRDVMLIAYDRHPYGRMIIYSLAELSIRLEDYIDAVEYYKEFVQVAPRDTGRYILQYKLYEAQHVGIQERIAVLEEFKRHEYIEKWAFELAYLYHRAGMSEKCVSECDELILWFSEGKYVEKAIELKMLYAPLTEEQKEKYESRNDVQIEKSIAAVEAVAEKTPEQDEIQVKPLNYGIYDTVNLQKELAKSMKQIMEATEEEEVDSTMDNIKKIVQESKIDGLVEEKTVSNETTELENIEEASLGDEEVVAEAAKLISQITGNGKEIEKGIEKQIEKPKTEDKVSISEEPEVRQYESQEELGKTKVFVFDINDAPTKIIPVKEIEKELEKQNQPPVDAVEKEAEKQNQPSVDAVEKEAEKQNQPPADAVEKEEGNISICVSDKEMVEKQITGQMSIEEVLQEWERIKAEVEEEKKKNLEDARAKAITETEDIMDKLAEVTPNISPEMKRMMDDREEEANVGKENPLLSIIETNPVFEEIKEEVTTEEEGELELEELDVEEESIQLEVVDDSDEEIDEESSDEEDSLAALRTIKETTAQEDQVEEVYVDDESSETVGLPEEEHEYEVIMEEADQIDKFEEEEEISDIEEFEAEEVSNIEEFEAEEVSDIEEFEAEEVSDIEEFEAEEVSEIEEFEAEEEVSEIEEFEAEEEVSDIEEFEAEEEVSEIEEFGAEEEVSEIEEFEAEEEVSEVEEFEAEEEVSDIEEFEAEEEVSEVEEFEAEEEVSDIEEFEAEEEVSDIEEFEAEEEVSDIEEFEAEEEVSDIEEFEEAEEDDDELFEAELQAELRGLLKKEVQEEEDGEDELFEAELQQELRGLLKKESPEEPLEVEDEEDELFKEEIQAALRGLLGNETEKFHEPQLPEEICEDQEVEEATEEMVDTTDEEEDDDELFEAELQAELRGLLKKEVQEEDVEEPAEEVVEEEKEEVVVSEAQHEEVKEDTKYYREPQIEKFEVFEEEKLGDEEVAEIEYEAETPPDEYEMVKDKSEEFEFEDLEDAIMREAQSALLAMKKAQDEKEQSKDSDAETEEYFGEDEENSYWAEGYQEAAALEGAKQQQILETSEKEAYEEDVHDFETETYEEDVHDFETEVYNGEIHEFETEEYEEEVDDSEVETYEEIEEAEAENYEEEEETEVETYEEIEEAEAESYEEIEEVEAETYEEEEETEVETYEEVEDSEEEAYEEIEEAETEINEEQAEEIYEEVHSEMQEEFSEDTEESQKLDEYSNQLYAQEEEDELQETEEDAVEEIEAKLTANLPEGIESISGQEVEEDNEPFVLETNAESFKKIFKYFTEIEGVSEQIVDALESIDEISDKGNVIIMGDTATGKTTLAVDIIRAAKKSKNITGNKIARISGESMNSKDVNQVIENSVDGVLIVEEAANMTAETVDNFSRALDETERKILVILEDSKEKMLLLLEMNREFRDKFTAIIDLPPYTNTDLVSFAKSYAKEKNYTIEEMGVLALYSKLAEMQFETDFIPTLYNVKELIDEAIEKAGKRKVKNTFGKFFSKRKEENQGKVLKEKDFI